MHALLWILLLSFALVALVAVMRRGRFFCAEHFASNSQCAGKFVDASQVSDLSATAKCSPGSPFPGLRQHPTLADSCYLSTEEPLISNNTGACSMDNPALGGIANVVGAAVDTGVDCLQEVCTLTFTAGLSDADKDTVSTNILKDRKSVV